MGRSILAVLVALVVLLASVSTGLAVYYAQTQEQIRDLQTRLDEMQSTVDSMQASLNADQSILNSGGFQVVAPSLLILATPSTCPPACPMNPRPAWEVDTNYTVSNGFLLVFAVSNDTAGLALQDANGSAISEFNWATPSGSGSIGVAPIIIPGQLGFWAFQIYPAGLITVRVINYEASAALSANLTIIHVNKFAVP